MLSKTFSLTWVAESVKGSSMNMVTYSSYSSELPLERPGIFALYIPVGCVFLLTSSPVVQIDHSCLTLEPCAQSFFPTPQRNLSSQLLIIETSLEGDTGWSYGCINLNVNRNLKPIGRC